VFTSAGYQLICELILSFAQLPRSPPSSLRAAERSTSIFPAARAAGDTEPELLTEAELQRRERENLLIILEKAN